MANPASRQDVLPTFTEKYSIERVLGRGGMGTVFEARHARLGQRVALKVLATELCAYPELVVRFEREARAASALSSPHAARVFDIDTTDDGVPFMVMELLSGCDLARRVDREGAQPIARAIRWMIEACDAIAEAHRLGIVHRDIKPSNLLLCDTGSIKVLDFGIAKHLPSPESLEHDPAITQSATPLGTPQYMSPEQVRCAKDVDGRTDIWSLGVTLYELVCGRPPFDHPASQACVAAIVADPVPDPRTLCPDLPEPVAAAILRALEKDPDQRFPTVEAFVEALQPFAAPASVVRTDSSTVLVAKHRSLALRAVRPPQADLHSTRSPTLDDDDVVVDLRPSRKIVGVPPALARLAARAMLARRVRSILAIACAAVCGTATLVATPRFMSAHTEPIAVTSPAPAPAVAPPPAPPEVATAMAGAAPPEPTEPASHPIKPPRTLRPRPSGERPVHGGLSGPGF